MSSIPLTTTTQRPLLHLPIDGRETARKHNWGTLTTYGMLAGGWSLSLLLATHAPLWMMIVATDLASTSLICRLSISMIDLNSPYAGSTNLLCDNAKKGNSIMVKALLIIGANPNWTNNNEHHPALYAAIEGGNQEILREVVKFGAKPLKHPTLDEIKRKLHEPQFKHFKKEVLELAEEMLKARDNGGEIDRYLR